MSTKRLHENWKEITEYRKKHSPFANRLTLFIVFIWTFVGMTFAGLFIVTRDINIIVSFFLYLGVSIPILLYFMFITIKEWKEKNLISGIFLVIGYSLLIISSTFRMSMRIPLINIIILVTMIFLYILSPIDLIRKQKSNLK